MPLPAFLSLPLAPPSSSTASIPVLVATAAAAAAATAMRVGRVVEEINAGFSQLPDGCAVSRGVGQQHGREAFASSMESD